MVEKITTNWNDCDSKRRRKKRMIKQLYKYPDNLIFTCNFKIELIDVQVLRKFKVLDESLGSRSSEWLTERETVEQS